MNMDLRALGASMLMIGDDHVEIRLERPEDHHLVESLTREAFWNLHVPGCDEHLVVHNLRNSPDFIPALDFVALMDGRIVGHILYSKCRVEREDGGRFEAVLIGPVSVLPELQGRGIGSALIRHSTATARELGYPAVFLYGDPGYYGRFGFRSGRSFGISGADGVYTDALMVLALSPGALTGVRGRLHEAAAFETVPEELEVFDHRFPPRDKRETQSQAAFALLVQRLRHG